MDELLDKLIEKYGLDQDGVQSIMMDFIEHSALIEEFEGFIVQELGEVEEEDE